MRRITFRWTLSLLLLATLVTGCVSFESVKLVATTGAQLSSQENAFDTAPAFCRIMSANSKSTGGNPPCEQLQNDLANWHKVNRSLVAYSKALNAMADDSKEKGYKDDISTMLGAASHISTWSTVLNTNVTAGVSAGVDALIHSITSVYRRAELKQTIEKSDGHIQNIATGFDQAIEFLDGADQNFQKQIETIVGTIESGSPERDAVRYAYLHLWMTVEANRVELANYKKAIDAFATAHHDLKKDISKVGHRAGDLEVLNVIAKDVSTMFTNFDKALTSPNK